MSSPLVLYHSPCQDGFTAAWVAHTAHPDWEFVPVRHGYPPPDVSEREVYLLDFSYKRPVLEKMLEKAKSITILDHHKTAQEDLEFLAKDETYGINNLKVIFDMEKSGARISYDYFKDDFIKNYGSPFRPMLIDYVEDRDLWKFQYKNTKAFSTYLFSLPYDFNTWTQIAVGLSNLNTGESFLTSGLAILRKQETDVNDHIRFSFEIEMGGFKVPCVNAPYFLASDILHILDKDKPFAVSYYFDGKKYIYSLRSEENGVDVSTVARFFGGGGHKHAAGFEYHVPGEFFTTNKIIGEV